MSCAVSVGHASLRPSRPSFSAVSFRTVPPTHHRLRQFVPAFFLRRAHNAKQQRLHAYSDRSFSVNHSWVRLRRDSGGGLGILPVRLRNNHVAISDAPQRRRRTTQKCRGWQAAAFHSSSKLPIAPIAPLPEPTDAAENPV